MAESLRVFGQGGVELGQGLLPAGRADSAFVASVNRDAGMPKLQACRTMADHIAERTSLGKVRDAMNQPD